MKIRRSWIVLLAAALLLAASCFGAVFADDAVPGTAADPFVSKSYMDAQIEILNTQIKALQEQIEALQKNASSDTPSEPAQPSTPETPAQTVEVPKFEVIKVEAGQQLIGEASTEIILRSGTSGGVADITGGTDLSTGTSVSKNHLILIPVGDGRGMSCTSLCYVMVKGGYTLK